MNRELDLSVEQAQTQLRELLRDPTLTVTDVSDESLRRARLDTTVEYRTLARVVAKEPEKPNTSTRDMSAMLWDIPATPEDPFIEEPRLVIDEPLSGAVGECPACRGKGERPCEKCGGTTRVPCESCRGAGYVADNKGATKLCRFCNGNKMQACATCKLGTLPCKPCKSTGQCYSIQRLTVLWNSHKERSVIALAPPEVPLDGIAPVHELAARNDKGALDDAHLSELDPTLALAARRLLSEHPLPDTGRVRSQTLLIERIPVYAVRYVQKGKEHTVRFTGSPARPFAVDAPGTLSWLSTVALVVLISSAVAALWATGIFRAH